MVTLPPIQCACGKFQAALACPEHGMRIVCYCRDCQAFAHFLNLPMLDAAGGTDIIAVRPRHVNFTAGVENLACMSLSPKGLLRWYTSCCGTPIGNTPRNPRQSHIGLIHSCLEQSGSNIENSFGPVKIRVNQHGAKNPVPQTPIHTFAWTMTCYLASMAWARVSGQYKTNPFFTNDLAAPLVEPKVLTESERSALMGV